MNFINFHNFISSFPASTIFGLTTGAIYALVALGYTLVYGVLRLINFAHSEIFMIGTMAAFAVLSAMSLSGPVTGLALAGVVVTAALAAAAASAGTAMVLERVAYRPLRKRSSSALAALITAIGASLFLQELFAWIVGRDPVNLHRVMAKTYLVKGTELRSDRVLVFCAAIAMMIVLDLFVNRTRLGRGIRATAQDPQSATLMGVNIDRIVTVTFLVGGAMAGVAGALYIIDFEQSSYLVGFLLGIKAFTAAVLGGIGNIRGALLGGLALGLIENYGASMVGNQWIDVIGFSVLVLVLMFRPTGLLGEALGKARA